MYRKYHEIKRNTAAAPKRIANPIKTSLDFITWSKPPATRVDTSTINISIRPRKPKYRPLKLEGTRSAIMLPQAGLARAPKTVLRVTKAISQTILLPGIIKGSNANGINIMAWANTTGRIRPLRLPALLDKRGANN